MADKLSISKERVAELQKMLDQSKAKYGENATETQRWQ